MSRITPLHPERILRRALTVGGVPMILWLTHDGQRGPMMALAAPRTPRARIAWRRLADIAPGLFGTAPTPLFDQKKVIQDATLPIAFEGGNRA